MRGEAGPTGPTRVNGVPVRRTRREVVPGAVVWPERSGSRSLRWAMLLAPTGLLLAVVGPGLAMTPGMPLGHVLLQPLLAGVGGAAGVGAVYHADRCIDEIHSIADQNLRVLLLLAAFVAITVSSAWVWLGFMNLLHWVTG